MPKIFAKGLDDRRHLVITCKFCGETVILEDAVNECLGCEAMHMETAYSKCGGMVVHLTAQQVKDREYIMSGADNLLED